MKIDNITRIELHGAFAGMFVDVPVCLR